VHVEDDHKFEAWTVAGKSLVVADQLKKRAESSWANESPEDSTRKHRRLVRAKSEDEEDDTSAYMLNPSEEEE
jgi:hypothetical protein